MENKKFYYFHGRTVDGYRFTVAGYYNPIITELILGIALCSRKDNFCKKTGRMISSGRVKKYLKSNNLGIKGVTSIIIGITPTNEHILKIFLTEVSRFQEIDSINLKKSII